MRTIFIILLLFTFSFYSQAQTDSSSNTVIETKEDLCLQVNEKIDKFTDEVSYNTPDIEGISFIKYKSKGTISQYVSISVYDTYLSGFNNSGLIILFKSGKKINRINEKIDMSNSTGANWRYSVFFTPTANEINLFKNDEITGVKLYIHGLDIYGGEQIKIYANCVLANPKTVVKNKK